MSGIGLKFSAEGEKEFKRSLADINQTFRVLKSEMKLVQSQFDKNDNSVEALTARNETLNKQIDAQKEKVNTLKAALQNAAASFGETDKRTKEWQVKLNNAEAALNGMERELKKNEEAMSDVSGSAKDMGNKVEDSGKAAQRSEGRFQALGNTLKAITASMTAVVAAAGVIGKKMWDMSNDVAEAGDEIDKTSQKIGISAESYQEWNYVFERAGANVDNLQSGMKTLSTVITDATAGSDKAAEKLKAVGLSIDDLNGKSQDEQLSIVIGALQDMESGSERTAAAARLFGKSASDMGAVLNMTAEETNALKQEAHDYGMVMSNDAVAASAAFEDSLTKLKGTLTGIKNNMIGELLPGITSIMDGFSDMASGTDKSGSKIKEGIQMIKPVLTDMAKSLAETLGEILPIVLDLAKEIIIELVSSIGEILPEILPDLFSTLFDLLDSLLTDGIPKLLSSLFSVAGTLLDSLLEKFPELLNKLITYIGNIDLGELLKQFLGAVEKIANMIAENLPSIITNLMNAIVNLIKSIDWKELISSGTRILMSISDGILSAIPSLIDALPDIIEAIIDFLTDPETILELVKGAVKMVFKLIEKLPDIFVHLVSALWKVGENLIKGLWEGISQAGAWLWQQITGFFNGIVDGIKGFFGIHSPSTLFRDEIGKNLALGIGQGFSKEMSNVSNDMKNAIPTDFETEMQATVAFNGAGSRFAADSAALATRNVQQTFNVTIYGAEINDDFDLDDLASRISVKLADEVRKAESVYA